MAENINNFGGVVGSVAVTAVNSLPPTSGTYVLASDAGTLGQVKMTPASVFQNSNNVLVGSGETAMYTSSADPSSCNSTGLTPQVDAMSVVPSSGVVSVDGVNTGSSTGTLPVTTGVKKTSFQITSVTVDSSASNDGGDDSADDLDESHTEDSSDVATDVSRHTSESRGGQHSGNDDNFTRNDIFYNPAPPSSMNIAPVIPTSSQYGLAIVPEGLNPVSEVPPPAPAIMNDPAGDKADPDKDIVHNRFKVVKIVSTEPFKKGRWMCMDYFDHTTTTSGTTSSSAVKDTTPPQPTQQSVPQSQTHSNIQQPIQSNTDKMPVNIVNVQGSNVPMTQSPPQPSAILPDSQQQTIMQQNQQPQHVIQTQMQNTIHEQEGSINPSGLPNGNGTHYHVNHTQMQGVNMNHVAPTSTVINSNVSDTSAFSAPIPNHNQNIPPAGNTYQSSMSQQQQQQQQQQYYNNTGVMTGMPSRPVSVAPTPSIAAQQQQSVPPQQPSMTTQQQSRPITSQVPIVQGQTQPQTLGQIGPQSSISQNTSVPLLSQTMSATQMHQAPVQVTQPSHLPAQSLPHGAHAQMTTSGTITNTPPAGTTASQQHSAQSLGHNMLQQNKPTFMNPPQHQQSQAPSQQTQFQQQNSQQQQQQMLPGTQQTVIGGQQSSNPQVGQVAQNTSNQQQPQNYQAGVMMQNIPGLQQQQVHVQQMNTQGVNQHSVQMQQTQPNTQTQGMYSNQGQMIGHSMSIGGQSMNMQQSAQPMMQQQNVIQNQGMIQQQQQLVGQQHHQQIMGMPQQQPMVSQPQSAAPQQSIMTQPQMMPQMMNTQMSGIVTQTPLVSQPGVMPQQQGIMPSQANLTQPNMIQQIPQQPSYQTQAQPQTINSQPPMQQPIMQPYSQPQPNPIQQQQQMMPPQSQSNIMAPQMGQPMTQGQQQVPLQQQTNQQTQQPPQQQPQVSIPSQQQQNVFQSPSQQMQVSQANVVQNMTNLQTVHNIMPPASQSIPQLPTSTGMPLQVNEPTNSNVSLANPDASNQQQAQSIVQQPQPTPVSVPAVNQVQVPPPAAPAEVHLASQNQSVTSQVPPVSTTPASTASPAITSLSVAATVIIDGVNSLGDTTSGGNAGNEEGESATGTNTVAIDNKIEQAMDLVKSHLMFAVREEVEVLKEKISELMERITQLEYENSILRANASQETLAQLQKSSQHPAPNVNEGHQGFS